MSELLVQRILDFSGGRNTAESDHRLPDSVSPDDLNLLGRQIGAIEKRKGTSRWTTFAPANAPILGLHRFYKSDGSKYLVYSAGSKLMYEDTSRVVHTIDEGFVPCQPFNFATFNDWCYMANFADLCYRWDGTSLIQTGLVKSSVPAGLSGVETGVGGFMDNGTYYYKVTASYGDLGDSNISAETLSATVAAGTNTSIMTLPTLSAYLPTGATKLNIWRTLKNPTANTNLRIYYLVGSTTGVFVDTKHDDELRVQYQGDRLSPYNAAFITKHRGRMWYAYLMERDGSLAYQSNVAYSAKNQPDILGDNANDLGVLRVFPNDDDCITGIMPLRGNLVVYKNRHIYSIMGDSLLDFEIRDTHADVGCIAPMSLVSGDNRHYFLSDRGIYAFDGTKPVLVSESIRPDLEALNPTSKKWAFGCYRKNRYYLSVQSG